ncbi:hypothetical protein ACI6QG_12180 [Roseococcus sp. DSY-14]|uniref:hypothetical protein n=1 Tax=Roseococcus sp. DSY-14 TaxID=3369650 RepID=UPI00387B00E8
MRAGGGAWRALRPSLPLLVWGGHFGAVYAAHALSCERSVAGLSAPVAVLVATAAALALLALLAWPGLGALRAAPAEGGESETGFLAWFQAAAAVLAAVAVLFQAAPALLVPGC